MKSKKIILLSSFFLFFPIFFFSFFSFPHTTSASKISVSPNLLSLNNGLVGYWTFDGKDMANGVALDKSGNGNNGNLMNISTSTFYAPGKIGQAGKFDGGDDYVNTTNTLSASGQYSVSFWAKKNGAGVSDPRAIMISQHDTYIDTCYNNQVLFSVNTTVGGQELVQGGTCASTGIWTYYTGTYNGSVALLYVNGLQVGTLDKTGNVASSYLTMGTYSSGSGFFFNGSLDDIRIYNRALSQSEITQLYNIGSATKQASSPKVGPTSCTTGLSCGLVGYWTFDGKDMTNGVALDKSGNGNNGNLMNISTSTFYVPGKIGQAGKFDGGDDYVNTAKALSTFMSNSDGTMTAWAYPTISNVSVCTGSEAGGIVDDGTSGYIAFGLATHSGGNSWCGSLYDGTFKILFYDSVKLNTWYHLVWMHTGGTLYLYVNGSLSGSIAAGNIVSLTGIVNIGRGYSTNRFFQGSLDDVRIYNRALSAQEVRQLYNMGR